MNKRFLALYTLSLRLYPKEFRQKYGDSMAQTLVDMLEDQPTKMARIRTYCRVGVDLQRSVISEQLQDKGEVIMDSTNKLLFTGFWTGLTIIGVMALSALKHIGTTWVNWPGFIRTLGLLAFLIVFIMLPACLAVLSLFGLPRKLVKKVS